MCSRQRVFCAFNMSIVRVFALWMYMDAMRWRLMLGGYGFALLCRIFKSERVRRIASGVVIAPGF